MSFDRVKTGDPFQPNAPAWNSMLSAAEAHELRQSPGSSPPPLGGVPTGVLVRNDTGADVPRFGVLGIDGPIIAPADNLDEFQGRIAVVGIAPAGGPHDARFVVVQEPLAVGAIGRGIISGLTVALLSESGLSSVGIVDGDASKLGPGNAATVLWDDGAATDAWAIVRLGETTPVTLRITAATQDGANYRWTYTARRQGAKTAAGWAGWADADAVDLTLYNCAEFQNGASGVYGNGVDQANIDAANTPLGSFALVPLPVGSMVEATSKVLTTGAIEYWCDRPNAVDGTCG